MTVRVSLTPPLTAQSFAVRLLRAQLDRPQRELQTDGTAAQVAPHRPCISRASRVYPPHTSAAQVAEMTASIRALLPPVANTAPANTAPAAAAEAGARPPAPAQTPPRNQQAGPLSPHISLHLPISPYISLRSRCSAGASGALRG